MAIAIERVQNHVNTKIGPGEAIRISEAMAPPEGVPQGDLYVMLVDRIPDGYSRVQNPTELDKQLVPGNTIGSRHCIESLDTVELYWPKGWTHSADYEELLGPSLVCVEETTILHPTHGPITIPKDRIVVTGYQRVYDEELRRERRAMD